MRAIALDIGDARIGVAASDLTGTVAAPVCVLPAAEVLQSAKSWRRILEDYDPEVLVCGLPQTMAGERGPQAEHVVEAAETIARSCGIPLEFADERLSSAEAKRILRRRGMNERQMRGKIDMIAASLFLQTWLDARRT